MMDRFIICNPILLQGWVRVSLNKKITAMMLVLTGALVLTLVLIMAM